MGKIGIILGLAVLGAVSFVFAQFMVPFPMGFQIGIIVISATGIGIVIVAVLFYISKPNKSPKSILRTRYTKGEITKEEYDQMKNNLEKE